MATKPYLRSQDVHCGLLSAPSLLKHFIWFVVMATCKIVGMELSSVSSPGGPEYIDLAELPSYPSLLPQPSNPRGILTFAWSCQGGLQIISRPGESLCSKSEEHLIQPQSLPGPANCGGMSHLLRPWAL